MYNLSLMSWNVRGIMSSTMCLSFLLNKTNCDICVISEHKLKDRSLSYLSTIEKNYSCYGKADKLDDNYSAYHGKGGVAILYRKSLQFSVVEVPNINSTRVVGIELKYNSGSSLFIFGAYLPSDECIDNYKAELNALDTLYTYYSEYGKVIIAGDLNGSCINKDIGRTNKVKSNELLNFVQRHGLLYAGGKIKFKGPDYTFIMKQSMLDYVLLSNDMLSSLGSYEILAEGSFSTTSDHLPVMVNINMGYNPHLVVNNTSRLPAWHRITEAQISEYQELLHEPISNLTGKIMNESVDIDSSYSELIKIIHEAADKAIPKCGFNTYTKPYWNANVKQAHDNERAYRKTWLNEGRPRGMQHDSYRNYKRAKAEFRRVQSSANEQYLNKCYEDLNEAAGCDIRLFWKMVKHFQVSVTKIYPEIVYNQKIGNTPETVANCFAEYFSDLYKPKHDDLFDIINKHFVEKAYADLMTVPIDQSEHLPGGLIHESEVYDVIKQLKFRKAAGNDKIQHEHLRYGGDVVIKCITALFNLVVKKGTIPLEWKLGLLVPIYKGGDKSKTSPSSYRPVSLLSCVYKVFENILKSRIQIEENFPSPQQQGFQKTLGCLTASFNLHETIYHNLEMCSRIYVAFLDSSNAFDTVWRKGLMYKLSKLGINGKIWSLINDCYTNTKSSIIVNQCRSEFFDVLEGVRQGGVLSGLLYLIFINDLLQEIEKCNYKTGIFHITCCCPTLADDISCISLTPIGLQRILDICSNYSYRWRFRFNPQKSGIIQFSTSHRSTCIEFPWTISGIKIPLLQNITHLGIQLDSKLNQQGRIEQACRKGRNSFFPLT